MDFKTAVRTVLLEKYVTFRGRAPRSEFWFFMLFTIGVSIVVTLVGSGLPERTRETIATLVSLGLFLPTLAVHIRRLHDVDRSGWWMLLSFIPVIGTLILLFWQIRRGSRGPNRFGEDPLLFEPVSDSYRYSM